MKGIPTLTQLEQSLADEFRRDGFPIHQHDGMSFIRIVHTTDHGEDIMTEINLTRLAAAIQRKLS